jgi:inorganic pyrophosphatase
VSASFDQAFWEGIDTLVRDSEIVIDRPKGTHHPRLFSSIIYPVDYGYLKGTASMDRHGIDVWLGSASSRTVDAIICTIDLQKKDSEVKILIGCTPEEMKRVYEFHNQSEWMKGLLIRRK